MMGMFIILGWSLIASGVIGLVLALSSSKEVENNPKTESECTSRTNEKRDVNTNVFSTKPEKVLYISEYLKPDKVHTFISPDSLQRDPSLQTKSYEYESKYTAGSHQEEGISVMTTNEYLLHHPEHYDRIPGSYFDRCAHPERYF